MLPKIQCSGKTNPLHNIVLTIYLFFMRRNSRTRAHDFYFGIETGTDSTEIFVSWLLMFLAMMSIVLLTAEMISLFENIKAIIPQLITKSPGYSPI